MQFHLSGVPIGGSCDTAARQDNTDENGGEEVRTDLVVELGMDYEAIVIQI